MSVNRFEWAGLDDLVKALRELPAALAGEADHVVETAANGSALRIRAIYGQHRFTGRLQDGVRVERLSQGPFGVAYEVISAAPHAWLFDNGTQVRHWDEGKNTGKMWTKHPPTHAFARTMGEGKFRMYTALGEMLERHGLHVSGSAGRAA